MNIVTLVGRVAQEIELKEEDKKIAVVTLAINRCFKNSDGVYETDFIPCILWNSIASNVADYCHKGDTIAVKGRLESTDGNIKIIAEKVTFLNSKKG